MLDVSDRTRWPFFGRLIGLLLVLLLVAASRYHLYVRLAHEVSEKLLSQKDDPSDAAAGAL